MQGGREMTPKETTLERENIILKERIEKALTVVKLHYNNQTPYPIYNTLIEILEGRKGKEGS
jgi:hypothetical protein